jgi:hypothetical protein
MGEKWNVPKGEIPDEPVLLPRRGDRGSKLRTCDIKRSP